MTPAVSVILPVFNAEQFLWEALESISRQTFTDFEVIAVDDGSTDTSGLILEKKAAEDPRFSVISQQNRGGAAARNRAIEQAQAPLIALMDADDIAVPERLALQVAYLEAHPEVGVLGAGVVRIDSAGARMGTMRTITGHQAIADELVSRTVCIHDPTVMMRRDVFLAAGGYREQLVGAYDLDLWLRMLPKVRFENLPRTLTLYRFHDRQVTAQRGAVMALTIAAVRSAYERRQKGEPDPVDTWDGSLDLGLIPRLALSPFEEALLYSKLLYFAEGGRAKSDYEQLSPDLLLDRIACLRLQGKAPRQTMWPLIRAVRSYWRAGRRRQASRLAARLITRAPRSTVQSTINRAMTSRPRTGVKEGAARRSAL
jgi:glycosyltransferase involved in cell wall biosynthesis